MFLGNEIGIEEMMLAAIVLFTHLTGQVTLEPAQLVYRIKRSEWTTFEMELVFKNVSDKPATFIDSLFIPNHRWVLLDRDGRLVQQTPLGVIYERGFRLNSRDRATRHKVDPGGTYRYKLPPLGECFVGEPGTYTLHIEYNEWKEDAEMRLTVKPIKVVVTK